MITDFAVKMRVNAALMEKAMKQTETNIVPSPRLPVAVAELTPEAG
jgi:hypothetical protein